MLELFKKEIIESLELTKFIKEQKLNEDICDKIFTDYLGIN